MAVFISYSHQDTAGVDRLARELLKRNVKVWRDVWQNAPGDSATDRWRLRVTRPAFHPKRATRQRCLRATAAPGAQSAIPSSMVPEATPEVPTSSDRLAVDWRKEPEDGLKKLPALRRLKCLPGRLN
jgi:hypothetical protein